MTPEGKVKKQLNKILDDHGVLYGYIPQSYYSGKLAGYPDVIAYTVRGDHFVVEVKSATGKLSPNQVRWRKILTQINVDYFLFDGSPSGVDELTGYLERRNNG